MLFKFMLNFMCLNIEYGIKVVFSICLSNSFYFLKKIII